MTECLDGVVGDWLAAELDAADETRCRLLDSLLHETLRVEAAIKKV